MLILDTCILIDGLEDVTEAAGISVMSLVEMQSGLAAATGRHELHQRQEQYDAVIERFRPLPIDSRVLERFGAVDAAIRAIGRTPRSRMVDLLIAATAAAYSPAVLTDNLDDFAGLEGIVEVRRPSRD